MGVKGWSYDPNVLFEQDGVFIHSNSNDDCIEQDLLISGSIRVVDKDGEFLVEYRPLEDSVDPSNMLCAGKDSSSVMEWGQSAEERPHQGLETQHSYETEWDMVNAISFKKKTFSNGDGALNHSQERYRWAFTFSVTDLRTITVKVDSWSSLFFKLKDTSISLPTLYFHQGGVSEFLDSLRRCAMLSESPEDESCLLVSTVNKTLSQSFENLLDDNNFGLVHLKKDPYVTTLGGFSKVTNYLYDAFRGAEEQQRPPEETADLLGEVIPGLEINHQEEPGFEVITRVDLGVRPDVQRGEPLGPEQWGGHQDPEGRVVNVPHLKQVIFKGGLCHMLRKEVWKFLLGYFPWDSTLEERKAVTRDKTDEYFRMKLQWKSVSEEQERRNSKLRDNRSLIEKDVNRTDRTNRFYEGIDNPGLVLLHDILMTYCMYDFDLGYVQGMSDLLSPLLFVMENEVDAFWCFVSFMDQMHQNFEEQMQGMKTQLVQLSSLLRLLDLNFWNYLESQDSGFLYFCFRWLLIRFKRELSFPDVLRLWEVMWTGLPCQNLHLLVCCSILDSEKQKIMEENYGFNEILKHVNELSMKLDIEEILRKAEAICLQIKGCKDLPHSVSDIMGFNTDEDAAEAPRSEDPEPAKRSHSPSPSPSHRGLAFSNGHGHLRESSQNGCKVSFVS
ncbi:TBC1 domain family member 15 isoform X2 [Gadus macrocephalus]|uniref:TBC1 domain family member 15 isoform X2 n=1 Tax=Gadus macrocephalus TaxID=80720 RepID=UPI0028CB9BFF|nr:TBC1 domain family member 15 isoform X2 [Gadus macrocephalus]